MYKSGDVVLLDFKGAAGSKRRPAVVVSSELYHKQRPDLILGIITTHLAAATASTDCILADWSAAGLRAPSAFRAYLTMAVPSVVRPIGHLSDRDWKAVSERVRLAIA